MKTKTTRKTAGKMLTGTALFDQASIEYFDGEDAKIAYRVVGSGPPLLLIHGWPLSGYTYRRLLPRLSAEFTCILPDLAGAGETVWDAKTDFTFPRQAERLKTLMTRLGEAMGFSEYDVLSQDTGATIARLLTLGDERVAKLIMLNTEIPNHRYFWVPVYRLTFYLPGTGFILSRLLRSRFYLRSSMAFGGSFQDPEFLEGEFRERFIAPAFKNPRFVQGLMKYLIGLEYALVDEFTEDHGKIKAKVLFIWGREDPTFPENLAREMISQFRVPPDFVSIPDARLLVHEEKPDEVCDVALPFLKS